MEPQSRRSPRGLIPRLRELVGRRLAWRRGAEEPVADDRRAVVDRLGMALQAHDLEAMVACFHADYRGDLPLHPTAGQIDRQQLRRNWEIFFADVPDLRTELLDTAESADAIWTEWRIWGTRRGGAAMDLRAVWIVGIRDGRIAWSRLYREPIQADEETTVGETVERLTRPD